MTRRREPRSARSVGLGPIVGILAAAALWVLAPAVTVAAPISGPAITAVLRADVPARVVIGSKVSFAVHLTTSGGAPIGNAPVRLYLGSTLLPRADRTDGTGSVTVTIRNTDLPAAETVQVGLRYAGSGTYKAASLNTTMVVAPATVRVATVPMVVGTHISLGTLQAATDASGVATFQVAKVGAYALAPQFDAPNAMTRISFDRWGDGVPGRDRQLTVSGDQDLALGLIVAYRGSLAFQDPEGHPVPPSRIDSVTLVGSNGQTQTVTDYTDVWLTAASSAVQSGELAAVSNVYRIAQVTIAGSNVVNAGQQTWQPTPNGNRVVEVLLYSLTVDTQDALLGSAVQGKLDLIFPDGTIRTSTVGSNGSLSFDGLARGQYTLKLHASGLTAPTPVALSRSQTATLRIISVLDLAIGLGLLILGVVLLLVLGRRRQMAALLGGPGRLGQAIRAGRSADRLASASPPAGSLARAPVRLEIERRTRAAVGRLAIVTREGSDSVGRGVARARQWLSGPEVPTGADHAHPLTSEAIRSRRAPTSAAASTTTDGRLTEAGVESPPKAQRRSAAATRSRKAARPPREAAPPAPTEATQASVTVEPTGSAGPSPRTGPFTLVADSLGPAAAAGSTAAAATGTSIPTPTAPSVEVGWAAEPAASIASNGHVSVPPVGPPPPTPAIRVAAADRGRVLAAISDLGAANERVADEAIALEAALRASRDRAAAEATQVVARQLDRAWSLLHTDLTRPKGIADFAWEVEPFYERARDAAAAALANAGDPAQWIAERQLLEVLRVLPAIDARTGAIRRDLDRAERRAGARSARAGQRTPSSGAV
jgi:hypothetical protein